MATLLEIYESHHNGQKKQFADQVLAYGADDFADDLQTDIADGVLSFEEAFKMLKTFIITISELNI